MVLQIDFLQGMAKFPNIDKTNYLEGNPLVVRKSFLRCGDFIGNAALGEMNQATR